jgi:hypothetical protein
VSRRAEFEQALAAGRTAAPGDPNPYYGHGATAVLWRRGYNTMMTEKVYSLPQFAAYVNPR